MSLNQFSCCLLINLIEIVPCFPCLSPQRSAISLHKNHEMNVLCSIQPNFLINRSLSRFRLRKILPFHLFEINLKCHLSKVNLIILISGASFHTFFMSPPMSASSSPSMNQSWAYDDHHTSLRWSSFQRFMIISVISIMRLIMITRNAHHCDRTCHIKVFIVLFIKVKMRKTTKS